MKFTYAVANIYNIVNYMEKYPRICNVVNNMEQYVVICYAWGDTN